MLVYHQIQTCVRFYDFLHYLHLQQLHFILYLWFTLVFTEEVAHWSKHSRGMSFCLVLVLHMLFRSFSYVCYEVFMKFCIVVLNVQNLQWRLLLSQFLKSKFVVHNVCYVGGCFIILCGLSFVVVSFLLWNMFYY